jgi:hypothetical protein
MYHRTEVEAMYHRTEVEAMYRQLYRTEKHSDA